MPSGSLNPTYGGCRLGLRQDRRWLDTYLARNLQTYTAIPTVEHKLLMVNALLPNRTPSLCVLLIDTNTNPAARTEEQDLGKVEAV